MARPPPTTIRMPSSAPANSVRRRRPRKRLSHNATISRSRARDGREVRGSGAGAPPQGDQRQPGDLRTVRQLDHHEVADADVAERDRTVPERVLQIASRLVSLRPDDERVARHLEPEGAPLTANSELVDGEGAGLRVHRQYRPRVSLPRGPRGGGHPHRDQAHHQLAHGIPRPPVLPHHTPPNRDEAGAPPPPPPPL